jgi:hypothetical protein
MSNNAAVKPMGRPADIATWLVRMAYWIGGLSLMKFANEMIATDALSAVSPNQLEQLLQFQRDVLEMIPPAAE